MFGQLDSVGQGEAQGDITFLGGGDNVESIEGEHHQCGGKFVT